MGCGTAGLDRTVEAELSSFGLFGFSASAENETCQDWILKSRKASEKDVLWNLSAISGSS